MKFAKYLQSTTTSEGVFVSPYKFVEEVFTITPDGRVNRVVRKGAKKIAAWNDPLNRTTQVLQLTTNGVVEIRRTNPRHSVKSQAWLEGNPPKGPSVVAPVLWLKFDEGVGDGTEESVTKTTVPIPGPKAYWKKSVSGTALEFDGYNTVVALPAAKAPAIGGGSLSLEAWFALGAFPWNWAPLVQQGDNDGYFLGVDSHWYPGFMVKVDGVWEKLSVPNHPLYTDPNHDDCNMRIHIGLVRHRLCPVATAMCDLRKVPFPVFGFPARQITVAPPENQLASGMGSMYDHVCIVAGPGVGFPFLAGVQFGVISPKENILGHSP